MLNSSTLKSLAQVGTALTLMLAASACSHEQLKDEAQAASIEETSTDFDSPTPDLAAPATPVPSDENQGLTAPVKKTSAKKILKKKKSAHHAVKTHAKKIAKHHRKHAKTMVAAAAGRVDSNLPPAPPTDVVQNEVTLPAPPVADAAVAGDLAQSNEGDGLPLTIALVIGALGVLAFAGIKVRKARGSRRLVFS